MAKLSLDQVRLAKRMRAEGYAWQDIANKTGISLSGLTKKAYREGWSAKGITEMKSSDSTKIVGIDHIAELVREQLASDIQSSVGALSNIPANELQLSDLEKRERIAESIQKRASSLLNIGNSTDKPVINVAIMSQLPSSIDDMNTVEVVDQ